VGSGGEDMTRLYIAVLDEFPDYMVPTLVAHSMLSAHLKFYGEVPTYDTWLKDSFKKCVLRVNQKEFTKIANLKDVYLGYENSTLLGKFSCAVVCPRGEYPNVLKFAKLWSPKPEIIKEEICNTLMESPPQQ
jgi:hypothetical protein